jgi:ABC-type nickel/cobalt efflux system permease component RcnA
VNDVSALPLLLGTAMMIAAVHTAVGVDHTLPFIALGRAQRWSLRKLLTVTALCGVGHVLSSVVLGMIGIALGTALDRLRWFESARGSLAAWLLIAFGAFFIVRSLWRSLREHTHNHHHAHADGLVHTHPHGHRHAEHMHPHFAANRSAASVWTLFIIFAFGPCEPLIPLLMAPAALQHWWWVVLIAALFGAVTIAVMVVLVTVGYLGLSQFRLGALERHAELFAGLAIAGSGAVIQALGL